MKKHILLLILMLVSTAHYVYADDTAFGGEGAVPMPIEQGNVKMVAEKVIIHGIDLPNPNLKGKWIFDCLYTFQNMTSNPLQFTMGFPFPVNNEEMGEITVPAGFKVKLGSPLVYDFKVAIDNKPIDTQFTKISANTLKDLYYTDAYKWTVSFKPNQLLNITHHYITGVTYDVMAHHWVRFVLRTGGLWQTGIIGHAQLEVIPDTPTRLCATIDKQYADSYQSTPKGMKIVGSGATRKYIWDLHQFRPTEDLSLCLVTGQDFVKSTVILPIIYDINNAVKNLSTNSCATLKLMRNTIYAQYGKKFDNEDLQTHFNKQWWYQSNATYSDKLLTQEDLKVIAAISKAESSKGCDK